MQNGVRREVPIIYGAPERWKSFQRDGYYRDKSNAIMLPIIVIKRDTITKDRTVANKLDANQPNLYGLYSKNLSLPIENKTNGSPWPLLIILSEGENLPTLSFG